MPKHKQAVSYTEQRRRAQQAKQNLVPAAIAKAGQVGFGETAEKLAGKPNVKNPKKLAGWLKGQAKQKGQLSPEHPYGKKKHKKHK